jgi:hypothetical protein
LPAVKAAILKMEPGLDSIALQRKAAGFVLAEINKLLDAGKYDPAVLVDWSVKPGRLAEGYIGYEYPRISQAIKNSIERLSDGVRLVAATFFQKP